MATVQLAAIMLFGLGAIAFGATVFRTKSMVRSALALLGAMVAIGGMFLAMETEFLGVLQLMMMASEMAIMAIFMMMYMMDPGGLMQMEMTHQRRTSVIAGAISRVVALVCVVLTPWGTITPAAPDAGVQLHDLGIELMTRSMLLFETAGFTILVAMIAATLTAIARQKR